MKTAQTFSFYFSCIFAHLQADVCEMLKICNLQFVVTFLTIFVKIIYLFYFHEHAMKRFSYFLLYFSCLCTFIIPFVHVRNFLSCEISKAWERKIRFNVVTQVWIVLEYIFFTLLSINDYKSRKFEEKYFKLNHGRIKF